MLLRHILKLVFRGFLLVTGIILHITNPEALNFTLVFQQGITGAFLWIVWVSLFVEMLYRIIPNKRTTVGARKHFSCSYRPTASAQENNTEKQSAADKSLHKGAILSAVSWASITALVLFALFRVDLLTPGTVLIILLSFAVLDIIFILFFCPFQTLFMRNHCCVVCRIYNWDYIMMCAPLIIFPGFYSASLVILSLAVLLCWEIPLVSKPHFFKRETNENLRCEHCEDKLCRLRIFSPEINPTTSRD